MRLFKLPGLLLAALAVFDSAGQSVSALMGARASSLGYASETLSDEWSLFNNVGGLSHVHQSTLVFAADALPSLEGANRAAFAFSTPVKNGTAGIGFFRFGDNIYNEQIICTGFSNKLGIASLGVKLNYIQYQAAGAATRSAISLSFGGITQLTPQLAIGAFITNINQPTISKQDREKLPTLLNAGISFKASEKFLFVTGVQKDLDYSTATFKAGVEYRIHTKLSFRTGINLYPDAAYFGFGFNQRRIGINYAIQHNSNLNFGHQMSLIYALAKPATRQSRTPQPPGTP